jgi:GNAT superfamily N-acetyltransferase
MTLSPEQLAPDVDFRWVWRCGDAEMEAEAIDFWDRNRLLPAGVDRLERAKELVMVARKDGKAVGVITGQAGRLDQVRARLVFFRGSIDPDYRRSHIGFVLLLAAQKRLEQWAADHPEERIAGQGSFMESRELAELARIPGSTEPFRLGVVGFLNDGRQIRVHWFRDFRLDLEE